MSDPNNIIPNQRYATAIAERGKFWPVDEDYLTSIGYDPVSGSNETGKYATLTYQINPQPITLSGDLEVGAVQIKDSDGTLANVDANVGGGGSNALNTVILGADGLPIIDFGQLKEVSSLEVSLTGEDEDAEGLTVDVSDYKLHTIHVTSTVAPLSGADVYVQSSLTDTANSWAMVGHIKIDSTSELTNEIAIEARAYIYLRVTIRNYQDGTYDAVIYSTS